jgi:hypothetical protein
MIDWPHVQTCVTECLDTLIAEISARVPRLASAEHAVVPKAVGIFTNTAAHNVSKREKRKIRMNEVLAECRFVKLAPIIDIGSRVLTRLERRNAQLASFFRCHTEQLLARSAAARSVL